ncbi:hypothetical protein RND81_01G067000 [Saponaria officinalis]|uniref:Uncharacterized protein n=1 Tax=Saponaria officinalis TaxID=3572 RepID=A0AAW1NDH1_SAPOF
MGVSFKISKRGTKYKPKPVISEPIQFNEDDEVSLENCKSSSRIEINGKDENAVGSSMSAGRDQSCGEDEISFVLNLYSDGYSIVKASENDDGHHAALQDGLKLLRPYDRNSEGLFAAIESGRLPSGIQDDIPCKFVDGAIMCEVRDCRKCIPHPESNTTPTINKVRLKMTLENVVKDIPLMADDSWTYGDLMEVESRIVNALQPKLCLDPVPRLDRLCKDPAALKINLGLAGMRKRRLRQIPEVTVTSNNRLHGKKICIDQAPENSNYGDIMSQHGQENVLSHGSANQRIMHNPSQGAVLPPGMSPGGQDMPISHVDNMNSAASAKVVSQDGQLSPYYTVNKRARLASDSIQHPQVGSLVDKFQGSDGQWRNQMAQNVRGVQYGNTGLQKYPQLVGDGVVTQDGVKLEKTEPNMVKSDIHMMEAEGDHMDPRLQQRFQHPLMRPALQQVGWNNLGPQIEKEPSKSRKTNQSPRLSAGAVAQSPLSVRSGEMPGGSMGTHYGAVSAGAPLGHVQREKSGMNSVPTAGRASSVTSSANDSLQHQHQAQHGPKRRNSLPKTSAISGVGSPVSVNNMGGQMIASSPSMSAPQVTEHDLLDKFSKIVAISTRHQLNRKNNKVDEFSRKPRSFSTQELRLASLSTKECPDDSREMSKSLVGGHMNVCKIRVIHVQQPMPGNQMYRTRLILSEKPNDGTVAMHYGDLNDADYLNSEEHLPTLPNTHWADLLAGQFCAMSIREGFVVEEIVQPRPPRMTVPSNSQPNASVGGPNNPAAETQQYSEVVPGQTIESKPTISNTSLNSTANVLPSSGMHPPGNSQGHMSVVSRPQQMDPQLPSQQQPVQHQQSLLPNHQSPLTQQVPPQFQRSPLMLPNNPSMPQLNAFGQGSNLPMGHHMGNKSSSPLPMMQQPNLQSQPAQMQRRMMVGLGTGMGMGQIGNNMGLSGLSNVMGIGGVKGMGPAAGMSPMSGMAGSNMVQNPMNLSQANAISQHLRAGTLNPQALVAAQRLKLMHSRGMLGGAQSGIAGMPGATRQIQPGNTGLSMLGQSLNRGNMGQMQRTAMGQMGMPNLMPGMNVPLNQQHYQELQQQQQQQQSRQHVLPQQEAMSPLQGVLSPQQVGSPSTMGIPQQMNQQQASPQQMSQRGPMSPPLSSGHMHPMSTGNPDACPASPALSSQTLGSVGSITNSPMELQGVNKSGSVTNT